MKKLLNNGWFVFLLLIVIMGIAGYVDEQSAQLMAQ